MMKNSQPETDGSSIVRGTPAEINKLHFKFDNIQPQTDDYSIFRGTPTKLKNIILISSRPQL